jgi:hypothetical protein
MKLTGAIFICLMVLVGMMWMGAGTVDERECIKYAPPTPTPIPPERIYSEWIPMPGSSAGMGKGWINRNDIGNYERTHNVLTDAEYKYIAKTYGKRQTMGSKMGYGFPPRIDFNTLYGGVILKNEWLPKRLRP